MEGGVYKIVAQRPDGSLRIYIGHSSKISERQRRHLSLLRRGIHPNPPLQAAWRKYGERAFSFEVLERCGAADLVAKEQAFVDAAIAEFGAEAIFNVKRECVSSRLGVKASSETKAKLSAVRRAQWQDASYRSQITANVRRALARPDVHERRLKALRKANGSPEVVQKQRAAQLIAQNRPATKAKKSAGVKRALATPESKSRRSATNSLLAVKANRSAAAKKRWADKSVAEKESFKATMRVAMKKWWAQRTSNVD